MTNKSHQNKKMSTKNP